MCGRDKPFVSSAVWYAFSRQAVSSFFRSSKCKEASPPEKVTPPLTSGNILRPCRSASSRLPPSSCARKAPGHRSDILRHICRTPRILHGQKHVCRLLLFHALRSDIPQCMPRRTCIFRGETRARHRLKSFPDCDTTHSACCTHLKNTVVRCPARHTRKNVEYQK